MIYDVIVSNIRTVVPATVVPIIMGALNSGLDLGISDDAYASLTVFLTALAVAAYHLAARLLEEHVHPMFGFLLGKPSPPIYPNERPTPAVEPGAQDFPHL